MAHQNYYQFEAKDEKESGYYLGELFKKELKESLEYYRSINSWKARVNLALPLLSATKKKFPEIYQELEGHAAGSKIDLKDFWAMTIEDELDLIFREKCTTMVTNNGMLIGHNEDWAAESKNYITVLKRTVRGVTTFELFYIGTLGGNSISINSHGVIQGINSLDHKDYQIGIPKNIISKDFSNAIDPLSSIKAFEKLKRSSGYHHLIISPTGRCFSLEATSSKSIWYNPKLPFVHTNHYLTELKRFENSENLSGTFRRFKTASSLLRPSMNQSDIKNILSNTRDGTKKGILNERTIARVIIDLRASNIEIWLKREQEKGWVSYPLDFFHY